MWLSGCSSRWQLTQAPDGVRREAPDRIDARDGDIRCQAKEHQEQQGHEQLAADVALRVYFAKPYCAWQRGTNENTNGLIRQFFPKGTDLASIPEHRFNKVQDLLNNRPRKRHGYRTPNEVLASCRQVAIEI